MENESYWKYSDYIEEEYKFELTTERIISSAFLIAIIIVTLLGNVLVCVAFCQYRRLRTITNYFVLSLAISDILVAGLSMPLFLSYELTEWSNLPSWVDGMKLFMFLDIVDIICCVSSIANLTAISIDRFFGIVMPLKHKTFMTESIALSFIVAVWVYSIFVAVTKLIPGFVHYIIFNFIAGFALPLTVIIGAYAFIFLTVKKHSKRKLSNSLSQEWALARTILIVISLFVFCWAPFYIIQILYQYCFTCTFIDTSNFDHVHSAMKLLHYFNSCCNPFVYGYFNVSFKQAFKSIFVKCFRKKEERDINSNAPDFSLATAYSFARNRSYSGLNVLLSEAEREQHNTLIRRISRENEQKNADEKKQIEQQMIGTECTNFLSSINENDNYRSGPEFTGNNKFISETLTLVTSLTFNSLQIKDTCLNMECIDSVDKFNDDVTKNLLNRSSMNIDDLLADSKESHL